MRVTRILSILLLVVICLECCISCTFVPHSTGGTQQESAALSEIAESDESSIPFASLEFTQLYEASLGLRDVQNLNAASVENITFLYFGENEIAEYIASTNTPEEFFGFDLTTLTNEYGSDVALTFHEQGGVSEAIVIEETKSTPHLLEKSFLKKIGIGIGIVFVGATISALSGGTFSCAFAFILKTSLAEAGVAAALYAASSTVAGRKSGLSYSEAFSAALKASKAVFADAFVAAAVVGSMYGIAKPLCLAEGTPIVTPNGNIAIEEIQEGDRVFAVDGEGRTVCAAVTSTFQSEASELYHVKLSSGDTLTASANHPFFVQKRGYVEAAQLRAGDVLQSLNGGRIIVEAVQHELLENPCILYNFEVEAPYHCYFAGSSRVLVHNECTTVGSLRAKANRDATKRVIDDFDAGFNPYSLTRVQIEDLRQGRVTMGGLGYEAAHIVDVSALKDAKTFQFIGDERNIVFLKESRISGVAANPVTRQHYWVHESSFKNQTNTQKIIELFNQTKELKQWITHKVAIAKGFKIKR